MKIRRTYEHTAGDTLAERGNIGENRAFEADTSAREAGQSKIDSILIHPVPASFSFGATFSHMESRLVQETYYEQESYTDSESYSCGTVTSYRTCTRTVTRYRSVPRTRMVTKMVPVTDGSCESAVSFAPAVNGVYLLQYTYQEHGACSLSCFEQVQAGGDSVAQKPCPAPLAAQ